MYASVRELRDPSQQHTPPVSVYACSRTGVIRQVMSFGRHDDGTDTDDTADNENVGGLGYYSHGSQSLTHHHWVRQLISGGSFGVHCTEAAEAVMKSSFRHPVQRVKHSGQNYTQDAMSKYLRNDLVYRAVKKYFFNDSVITINFRLTVGVTIPLKEVRTLKEQHVTMGTSLATVGAQQTFLHPNVRVVARVEILDLICDKLHLPHRRASYRLLESLQWDIGQKLILPGGKIFWATSSDYHHALDKNTNKRHDIVRLHKTEPVEVFDGDHFVKKETAQCCRLVLFFALHGLRRLPAEYLSHVSIKHLHNNKDSMHLLLGRFYEAHPRAISRDSEHRPVCPGPLHVNNCLWRYAKTDKPRAVIATADGCPASSYLNQIWMFGQSAHEQHESWLQERHAYYTFIHPLEIKARSNMTPLFEHHSTKYNDEWMETVTMI